MLNPTGILMILLFLSNSFAEKIAKSDKVVKLDAEPIQTSTNLAIKESSSTTSRPPTNSGGEEELPEITEQSGESASLERQQITYDQRQEGKYNIRADLENFMILVIPPNLSAGVNLLDLLSRNTGKRFSSRKHQTKKHETTLEKKVDNSLPKNYSPSSLNARSPVLNYLNRFPHPMHSLQPNHHQGMRFAEFIEGRTPYRVDITSTENDFGRVQSEPQIDVLPPPYPAHLSLIKPYHLEVEPPIISPANIHSQIQAAFRTNANAFNYNPSSIHSTDEGNSNELKLLGASEQCGPLGRRDSYGLCHYLT